LIHAEAQRGQRQFGSGLIHAKARRFRFRKHALLRDTFRAIFFAPSRLRVKMNRATRRLVDR
jgi:hypothetical protein